MTDGKRNMCQGNGRRGSYCDRVNLQAVLALCVSRLSQCSQVHTVSSSDSVPKRPTSPTSMESLLRSTLTHCPKCYSSGTTYTSTKTTQPGLLMRVRTALGLNHKAKYRNHQLILSGYGLLRSCAEFIDYEEFFEVPVTDTALTFVKKFYSAEVAWQAINMPDTFNSWFLILELHIWLCMVRLVVEGYEGKMVRNNLIEAMWKDVQERAKQLGGSAGRRREAIDEMNGHFRASLLAYDEGLLSDDRVLAGALWRVFFEKRDVDPQALALMMEYVRKQVKYLDGVDTKQMLCSGLITFLPLRDDLPKNIKRQPLGNIG